MSHPALVSLRVGTLRGSLSLQRTPKYLRFVWKKGDWKTLDALDQLDDTPNADEEVLAAVIAERGSVHLCIRGKNRERSGWRRTATYELTSEQPPQELLRDTAKWQAWCFEQDAKSKGKPA